MPVGRTQERGTADVLIVGGGPAGATAAGLLAAWGRSVIVVHSDPRGTSLAESLPAGSRKLFDFLGQADLIDAAGFHPNCGNVSDWAGRRTKTTSDVPGYHVSRAAFDRVLRRFARSSGASFIAGRVRRVEVSDPLRIECRRDSGSVATFRARYVLDCSGRTGVVARKGLRQHDAGYRTVAVVAEWECRGWPSDEAGHVFIESYRDGWAWSVPLSSRRRQCTVMIDPARRTKKSSWRSVYADELRKAAQLSARLGRASQRTEPWTCDASVYGSVRAADSGILLVGDAASFIESLSSAGVRKAMTSAWRAAVVANTCLSSPSLAGAAADFFDRRERLVYADCTRRAAEYFGAAAAAYDDEFWKIRASAAPDVPAGLDHELTDAELRNDPGVATMFERLRGCPALRLRAGASVRFEPVPSIEGREIVLRDALVVPGASAPVRFAAGVNLPELVRLAGGQHDLPGLAEAYQRRVGGVAAGGLLASLSLLVARGLLVPVGTRRADL